MRTPLNLKFFVVTIIVAVLACAATSTAFSEQTGGRQKVPGIYLADVPLLEAIKHLARECEINYILDPRLAGSVGPDGKFVLQPSLKVKWENISPREALEKVLKTNDLVMVENPATTVARIAHKDLRIKPVPAAEVRVSTNAVIPLITMEQVGLDDAITRLAKQAHLNPRIDQQILGPYPVSIRWEKITPEQALAALLDNYDLTMVEESAVTNVFIKIKRHPGTGLEK